MKQSFFYNMLGCLLLYGLFHGYYSWKHDGDPLMVSCEVTQAMVFVLWIRVHCIYDATVKK